MKITTTITIASSLLLAVGCANESRQARNTSVYSTSPYYGGTYSGSASESSGYAANASENQSANQTDVNVQQGPLVSQIRSSLENQADLAAVAPNIQISENNGSVTLSGMVQSEAQKQNIQSLVQQISGVTTVNNELRVSSRASMGATGENNFNSYATGSSTNGEQETQQNQWLNPTSRTNENSSVYSGVRISESSTNDIQNEQDQSLSPTSRTNENNNIYSDFGASESSTNNVQGGENESLSATSRTNGLSNIYSGLDTNGANNELLGPTSRTNSESDIYSQTNSLSPTSDRSSESGNTYSADQNMNTSQSAGNATGQAGTMNIEVEGQSATDQTLGQQIRQQLSGKTALSSLATPIQIRINSGVVTIQGNVPTQQQKQEIATAVQNVTGVARVDNQLTVNANPTAR